MKMFKRLLTGALSAACVLGMTMSVSAAETPSIIYDNNAVTKVTSEDGGTYEWVDLQDGEITKLPPKVVEAIVIANDATTDKTVETVDTVDKFVKAVNDPVITEAFSDGQKWVWRSTFGNVLPVGETKPSGETWLNFTVKGIGTMKDVRIVHYDEKNKWQILDWEIVDNDTIKVKFNGFSPAAIAVVTAEPEPTTTPTPTPTVAPTGNPTVTPTPKPTAKPSSGSNSSGKASGSGKTSPKTGVETDWMGYAAAAAILAACGAVVSRKKRA